VAIGAASSLIFGLADGALAFSGSDNCMGWYKNTLRALIEGGSCDEINNGHVFKNCQADILSGVAQAGGILAAAAALDIDAAFQAFADSLADACKCKN
jgi:hypothetical protein